MDTTARRLSESAGMLMIGDGVLGMMYPREHCLLWRGGPSWWRSAIDWFATHPSATRGIAAAEVAAGLWLARRQEPSAPHREPDLLVA
jgi:hypothetical protein